MASTQDPNAFPIQIYHNTDGWHFLPKEYNAEQNAWLYECPSCKSQIIVMPFVEQTQEEIPQPEEKPEHKKKRGKTNSTVSGELAPLSLSQPAQQNQLPEQATEASQEVVESQQFVTETGQEQTE